MVRPKEPTVRNNRASFEQWFYFGSSSRSRTVKRMVVWAAVVVFVLASLFVLAVLPPDWSPFLTGPAAVVVIVVGGVLVSFSYRQRSDD
jgi:uncharacterized membrane-anchored protein